MTSGQLQQINRVKGKTKFSHLRKTPDNQRAPLIEIGERERQKKEGGGQRRGSRTQEERREATHCFSAQTPRGRRGDREPSSLTDAQQERGERREPLGSLTHSSNFKPAPTKQEKQRDREKTERKKVWILSLFLWPALRGTLWTFKDKQR